MDTQKLTPADFDDGFVVAIQIDAKPGEEEAVAAGMSALVEPSRAEPGIKMFAPYRSPTNPAAFFVFELYRDEAAWADHQRTAHFKTFVDEVLPRVSRRERVPFVPFGR